MSMVQVETMRLAAIASDQSKTPEQRRADALAHIAGVRTRGDASTAAELERAFAPKLAALAHASTPTGNGLDGASALYAAGRKLEEQARAAHAAPAASPDQARNEDDLLRRWESLREIDPMRAGMFLLSHQREITAARQRRGA